MQFELAKGVPTAGKITDANTSEFSTLQDMLQSGRLYVLDRWGNHISILSQLDLYQSACNHHAGQY